MVWCHRFVEYCWNHETLWFCHSHNFVKMCLCHHFVPVGLRRVCNVCPRHSEFQSSVLDKGSPIKHLPAEHWRMLCQVNDDFSHFLNELSLITKLLLLNRRMWFLVHYGALSEGTKQLKYIKWDTAIESVILQLLVFYITKCNSLQSNIHSWTQDTFLNLYLF